MRCTYIHFCCLLFSLATFFDIASAVEVDTDIDENSNTATTIAGIHFTADSTLYYDYLSTSVITQEINNDSVVINSEIAWRFALRCSASDESGADLILTIQILKAKMSDPAISYEVNSSDRVAPSRHNILRHFLLLNGKSLHIRYNYKQQGIETISGGEAIIAAIRKNFPDTDFGRAHRITQQAEQQFSNTNLLRLWSRILLGARSGKEIIELGNPLDRSVTRNWQGVDGDTYPYTLKLNDAPPASDRQTADTGRILNTGSNSIAVHIDTLSGTGFIHIVGQTLEASTQSIEAKVSYQALTQKVVQTIALTWKLARIDPPALAPRQKQGVKPVNEHSADTRSRSQE